nr:zinc finger BED domain-containing protein RICESLEEPER 2-like [Ipomoea batatas]
MVVYHSNDYSSSPSLADFENTYENDPPDTVRRSLNIDEPPDEAMQGAERGGNNSVGIDRPPIWRNAINMHTLKLFVMDSISLNQTTGKQTTDTIVDDAVDGMPGLESTSKKCKSKELTSDVWNFFTKIGVDADGTHKAKCNGCLKEFRSGGKQNGTSSLRRHREICRMLKSHDLRQMFVTNEGKLASRKVDPNIARELLASADKIYPTGAATLSRHLQQQHPTSNHQLIKAAKSVQSISQALVEV